MNNPPIDFHAILPELILAVTLLVVLFVDVFLPRDRKWWAMPISFAGMTATLIATLTLIGTTRVTFGGSYVIDDFAVLFKLLFESVALVILLLCWRYLRDGRYFQGEFYFLLLCSFLGCITMASSRDLLLLFISLEMVSAPGFLLAGLRKGDLR
jgi:NADH-quinone oxidoreductase subunit N